MKKISFLLVALICSFAVNAKTTTVEPGTGNLSSAISEASAGDVLELQTGEYVESSSMTIDKMITIQAGVDQVPVVKPGSYFKLTAGGLTLRGIKFDANNSGEYFINVSGAAAMNIVLDGCEICGYPKYMINVNTKYHVDTVLINDCYIHDMTRSIIYCYANSLESQRPGCNYFKMTNSTACNMALYSGVAEIFIRNNDNDTKGEYEPTVILDHVTMYNYLAEYGAIRTDGGEVTITNSIFDLSQTGKQTLRLAKSGIVKNCLFYETTVGGTATFTDTLMRDPQFVNAAAKDLTFKKTSPAIGAGTDKSNIGDPRWGVQADVRSFAMGNPATAEVVYEPSYTLSWSVNDPAGTATIQLEYATSAEGPWSQIVDGLASSTFQYEWDMTGVGYGTYYVRGTLSGAEPITSVAQGTVQYAELIPEIYYVTTTGDDTNDGKSWATAKATIASARDAAKLGDTVKVAAGTYNEYFAIKDGIHVYGSYNPSTGVQSLDGTPSILDGTDLGHFLVVKYDNGCVLETHINGFILEKAEHSADGGGAFIRENCVLENCIIRNCVTAGAGGGVYSNGGTIRNCLIEMCYTDGSGGAIRNKGGVVEGCIIRGCQGKYAAARNEDGGVIYNCLFYNNEPSTSDWPASGGVYNPSGTVYNCTFACNYGDMYAGSHSDNVMYNCVFWGNMKEDGFADPNTYIAGSSTALGSGNNAGDEYFEAQNFTLTLDANNMDIAGPNFVAPTTFVGAPKTNAEIAAMRAADFSLLATSPLIDKGRSVGAPETDIEGTARPKKNGIDLGAYEFDPNAKEVVCTGIALNTDSLTIHEESQDALAVIFTPAKTTDRRIEWESADPSIASVDEYGVVTGVKVGKTTITATHVAKGFSASAIVVIDEKPIIIIHPEVLAADSLYKIEDYTIPSYIPFWAAKEAARADSSETNLEAMRAKIKELINKNEPYCLVANINGDPKTRMAFNWFTNDGVTDGEVQIVAKADAVAADFAGKDVITVEATATQTKKLNYAVSTSGIIKATGMDKKTAYYYTAHKALAKDLTPNTTYSYRVGFEGHWSAIATFQTAATNQGDYSFVYMTDSHIMNKEYVENANWSASAVVKNVPEAKFCVFPGDFVETGTKSNSEWEWEQWFETSMRPALYQMPFVVTDGNHDDTELLNYDWHFNTDNEFNKSCVVKPQFQGITYSFVYGDVLFLVFSMQDYWRGDYDYTKGTCTYLTTDVGNWFRKQVIAHPECKYRVTLCHKNVFSGSGHQEDEETPMFRATMLPIFKECEIDLAIQGHDHCYEVMGPVVADSIRPIKEAISDVDTVAINTNTNMTGLSGGTFKVDDGTLYFIGATCGRKRYYPYDRAEMDANYSKHQVENYFDLFNSRFGQPGAPSFTKFTVKADGLYLDTYSTDDKGTATLFNSIKVVRTKEHSIPMGIDFVDTPITGEDGQKIIYQGQMYILKNGHVYNTQGAVIK